MSGTAAETAWEIARIAALAAFFVLALAVVTGEAIRTAYLAPLARNRNVMSLHIFLSWFWIPLIVVHIGALLIDGAAHIAPRDVVIPFQTNFAPGSDVAVGLGTCGFLLLLLATVTAAFRKHLSQTVWRWIHRLTYPMFVLFLFHAQLAGSDFSRVPVSAAGWALAGLALVLALPRLWGTRMETASAD